MNHIDQKTRHDLKQSAHAALTMLERNNSFDLTAWREFEMRAADPRIILGLLHDLIDHETTVIALKRRINVLEQRVSDEKGEAQPEEKSTGVPFSSAEELWNLLDQALPRRTASETKEGPDPQEILAKALSDATKVLPGLLIWANRLR